MSKLTEQIFLSKWNEWEHEKVIEFGRKLYEANPNSNEWHWFNATYERQDVEWIRELMNPKVELKKQGRWRAEKWGKYFFLDTDWEIESYTEDNDSTDNYMYSSGNYYQTREDTEFAWNRQIFITKVNDRIDELNDGWVADWDDANEPKYFFYFFPAWNEFEINKTYQTTSGTLFKYLPSKDKAQTIISEFGDDLKKYIFTN